MNWKRVWISIVIIFPMLVSPVHGIQETDILQKELDEFFQREIEDKGAIVGVSLRSADTGNLIYERQGNTRLRPASNLKLFTAVAALSTLGPDHVFRTEVLTDGGVHWRILKGNLYLKGKGDPTLRIANIKSLITALKELNIKVIQGDLIGDDTWFDDIRYSIDLPWSDETFDYAAQISPLTFSPNDEMDTGNVKVEIRPSVTLGEKGVVSLDPHSNIIELINTTETVSETEDAELIVEREHGTNRITVAGKIPVGKKVVELVPIWEPTSFVLDVFKGILREQGIVQLGDMRIGTTPVEAQLLASNTSISLSEILLPFMKYSNNTHGEMLVKEMGKQLKGEGSWEKGLEILEQQLASYGINTDTLLIRDGSGISHVNLVPANEITNLLFKIQGEDWFPFFLQSLPVAGMKSKEVGGTLRYRMQEVPLKGKVLGKTGTLTSISSISGYGKTQSGQTIIYSILLNNLLEEENGKELEDRVLTKIMAF